MIHLCCNPFHRSVLGKLARTYNPVLFTPAYFPQTDSKPGIFPSFFKTRFFKRRLFPNKQVNGYYSILQFDCTCISRLILFYVLSFASGTAIKHSIRRLAPNAKRRMSMSGLQLILQHLSKISTQMRYPLGYHGDKLVLLSCMNHPQYEMISHACKYLALAETLGSQSVL